ncbi:MAG: glycogen debranching enzyme family protein [Oligoflexia bacterium]|nr:glycogen debranching enzyme family protein [Oligoflexia bacterium]
MGVFFNKRELGDLNFSLKREWLDTNGIGGYALSTISGVNTRKYHSWFAVELRELGGRHSLLSKVGATLETEDGMLFELDSNKYPFVFQPHGYSKIARFDSDLFPKTLYQIDNEGKSLLLEQSLMLVHKKNMLLLQYSLNEDSRVDTSGDKGSKGRKCTLKLFPLLSYRGIHTLTKANCDLNVRSYYDEDSIAKSKGNKIVKLAPYYSMPELYIDSDEKLDYFPSPAWHYNMEYIEENNRGFDYQEDLYRPGIFEKEMRVGDSILISFSLEKPVSYERDSLKTIWNEELNRRKALKESIRTTKLTKATKTISEALSEALIALKTSARQFLVEHQNGNTSIVAGYPWFGEWGRDTMISIPGITIHGPNPKEALRILESYAKYIKDGVIPNYLPERDGYTPAYNSVDASLWFFYAIQEYYIRCTSTSDHHEVKVKLKTAMWEIIRCYLERKNPFAELKENGLIWAGDANTQLTWMDARVDDRAVTPRYGFAVEINALWYNALSFYLELFASDDKLIENEIKRVIKKIEESFIELFYNKRLCYLADVVNEHGQDLSLRPNQIFAVSLPYTPLKCNKDIMKSVVEVVKEKLLTPYGLRTLSPDDPRFCPRYEGGSRERDGSYHQGTVWPWPIYHFTEAYLRVADADNKKSAADYLYKYFESLVTDALRDHGINSVAEIYDGASPYRANGCPFQAWSVAEVIRTYELLSSIRR